MAATDRWRASRSSLGGMTAQIGADGLDFFGNARPELLADVARVLRRELGEHPAETARNWMLSEVRRING